MDLVPNNGNINWLDPENTYTEILPACDIFFYILSICSINLPILNSLSEWFYKSRPIYSAPNGWKQQYSRPEKYLVNMDKDFFNISNNYFSAKYENIKFSHYKTK